MSLGHIIFVIVLRFLFACGAISNTCNTTIANFFYIILMVYLLIFGNEGF